MAAVELLAFAARADAIPPTESPPRFATIANGASTPVDVSSHTVLRLDVDARANLGAFPDVRLHFEHGPTASGPWLVLLEKHLTGPTWPSGAARVVLDGFDNFVRVRWSAKAGNHASLDFSLGVSGEGTP
jgi:hypothetical protein